MEYPGEPNRNTRNYNEELKGIGGWLILFLIGRFASAAMETYYLFQLIAQARGSYFSDAGTSLYVILVILILGHIGLEASIITLMFLKKMLFRIMFIINVAYIVMVTIGYPLITSGILGTHFVLDPTAISSFVAAIPWTIYLFVSRRVKNTFAGKPVKPGKEEEDTFGWKNPQDRL